MSSSQDLWVNLTNALLGIVVLLFLLVVLFAVVAEIVTRFWRRRTLRAELEDDLRNLARLASHR